MSMHAPADMEHSLTQAAADSEMQGKYLTFWIDRQLFGIPIADVVQIIGLQSITEIPEFPSYAKGIICMRGSVITLIDMRLRLGKEPTEYDERTCIIITNIHETQVGFIVDAVDEVANINEGQISAPPQCSGQDTGESYLTGIARQADANILLLDIVKIYSESALRTV